MLERHEMEAAASDRLVAILARVAREASDRNVEVVLPGALRLRTILRQEPHAAVGTYLP